MTTFKAGKPPKLTVTHVPAGPDEGFGVGEGTAGRRRGRPGRRLGWLGRVDPLPPEVGHGPAKMLVVLDTKPRVATQIEVRGVGVVAALIVPRVNDQPVVHEDAHTVIGAGVEPVIPTVEIERTRPPHRVVGIGDPRRR